MLRKFKNCKVEKKGSQWIHISSSSNIYKTDIKVLRDDSFEIENGETIYLEHLGKSYFKFIESEKEILEFRNKEIYRYFENAIKKDWIVRFLKEYLDFKKDYMENGNLDTQKTISKIDDGLVEHYKKNKKNIIDDIMGKLSPIKDYKKALNEAAEKARFDSFKKSIEKQNCQETDRKLPTLEELFGGKNT